MTLNRIQQVIVIGRKNFDNAVHSAHGEQFAIGRVGQRECKLSSSLNFFNLFRRFRVNNLNLKSINI